MVTIALAMLFLDAREELDEGTGLPQVQTLRQFDAQICSTWQGSKQQLRSALFQLTCSLVAIGDAI